MEKEPPTHNPRVRGEPGVCILAWGTKRASSSQLPWPGLPLSFPPHQPPALPFSCLSRPQAPPQGSARLLLPSSSSIHSLPLL